MLLIFLCVWGFSLHVFKYGHRLCASYPQRPDDCVRSPRTGIKGGWESPHRYWEMNLCPLQEQQLLFLKHHSSLLQSLKGLVFFFYMLWAHSASLIMSNFTPWHPFYFLREILVLEAFKKSKFGKNAFPPKPARCSSLFQSEECWIVEDGFSGFVSIGTHSMKESLSQI